jgi:hypothetical protein
MDQPAPIRFGLTFFAWNDVVERFSGNGTGRNDY